MEKKIVSSGDDRDQIPYQVYLTPTKKLMKTEEREVMGKYLLDPNVCVGEYIIIDGKSFRVKRVTFVYEFRNKKHVVTAKKLDVYLSKTAFSALDEEILQ